MQCMQTGAAALAGWVRATDGSIRLLSLEEAFAVGQRPGGEGNGTSACGGEKRLERKEPVY